MDDYEVGFGKPPKHTRFQSGISGNPKGRPKLMADPLGDQVQAVLEAPVRYRENGRTKTASRSEVRLKMLLEKAVKGDVLAADTLLEERNHALKHGEAGGLVIKVVDWLADFAGQTAAQKAAAASSAPSSSQPAPLGAAPLDMRDTLAPSGDARPIR